MKSAEQGLLDSLTNAHRLAELEKTRLMDSVEEPTFNFYTRMASRLLGVPVSLISLVDSNRQFFKSSLGLPQPYQEARQTPLSHSFCQHVVHTESPLMVSDAVHDPLVKENLAIRDLSVNAYLGVPIDVNGQTLGAFCAIDCKPRHWTDSDLEVMKDLVLGIIAEVNLRNRAHELEERVSELEELNKELQSVFAKSLDSAARSNMELRKVHHQLASLVLHDPLTRCYNRQYLPQAHEHAMEIVKSGHSCAVMAIDLDHFKNVNDSAGHAAGDRLLRAVTQIIKSCLREGDELIRTGGDEFIIFLRGISCEEATAMAETIRFKVDTFHFHDSRQNFRISLSIGVTCFSKLIPLDELLARADAASYKAKTGGKNRVVVV